MAENYNHLYEQMKSLLNNTKMKLFQECGNRLRIWSGTGRKWCGARIARNAAMTPCLEQDGVMDMR